jgi:crotonobetainyl-CoA:carnitine CoA-transferase CaiB-like acyl-CoA transferase
VLDPADAHEHPYFVERGMVRMVTDPLLGEMRVPGNPMRFSVMPEPLELVAPMLGEHNAEVLGSMGYSAADVERLTSSGVLSRGER